MYLDFINFIIEKETGLSIKESHPSIDPQTGRRYRRSKQIEEVRRLVNNSNISRSRIWVTYSDVPKLGIKPELRASKSTPMGVFAYPVDYYLSNNGVLPFASDREYLIIFEAQGKILEVGYDQGDKELNYSVPYLKLRLREKVERALKLFAVNNNVIPLGDFSKLIRKISVSSLDNKKEYFNYLNDSISSFVDEYKKMMINLNYKEAPLFKEVGDEYFIFSDSYLEDINKPGLKDKSISCKDVLSFLDKDVVGNVFYDSTWVLFSTSNSNKFKKEILDIIKEIADSYHDLDINKLKIPMESKLKEICDEYKLDLKSIFNKYVNSSNILTFNYSSILYGLTKFISREITKKNSLHHANWNLILRKLGFSGVVDTKNTGQVHPSEMTQGVFLDVRNLKIIDMLKNVPYSLYNLPTEEKTKVAINNKILGSIRLAGYNLNNFVIYNDKSKEKLAISHLKKSINLITYAKLNDENYSLEWFKVNETLYRFLKKSIGDYKLLPNTDSELIRLGDLLINLLETGDITTFGKVI